MEDGNVRGGGRDPGHQTGGHKEIACFGSSKAGA